MARALAVFGADDAVPTVGTTETFALDGMDVRGALVHVADPEFDPEIQRTDVLVRVRAFSCNYRDAALILAAQAAAPDDFYVIGSELAGHVLAVGADVDELAIGDRVMVDAGYGPGGREPWGLPTNHASRELQVLPASKLLVVPEPMDPATATAIAVGGQTTAAMVRRSCVGPGDAVLVTAGRSATSLFLVPQLADRGCDVTVITGSHDGSVHDRLRGLGATNVVALERPKPVDAAGHRPPSARASAGASELGSIAKVHRGFAAVFDPFLDVHLPLAVKVLGMGGRIVSCGVQRAGNPSAVGDGDALGAVLAMLVWKQATIIGNCLGTTADLRTAIDLWADGRLPVVIDSIVDEGPGQVRAFLDRTFTAPDRLGKVVFRYDA
jgi:NADPH:quinone reductase-like Zn-dependent oxidoreductase